MLAITSLIEESLLHEHADIVVPFARNYILPALFSVPPRRHNRIPLPYCDHVQDLADGEEAFRAGCQAIDKLAYLLNLQTA